MSVSPDLVLMEELVKICQEATDVNADQDFWGNTVKLVRFSLFLSTFQLLWLIVRVIIPSMDLP